MPEVQAAGVIHDLGYRGYDGPRLGRAQIVKALTWHSFRSAFGIGRGVKGKIVPVLAFIAMCLPAVVNAFAVARGNQRLFGYDVYSPTLRVALVTIFIAAQAPELVSRDLRSRVLPLYFCRPLRRTDYPLAKFLALACAFLSALSLAALQLRLHPRRLARLLRFPHQLHRRMGRPHLRAVPGRHRRRQHFGHRVRLRQ